DDYVKAFCLKPSEIDFKFDYVLSFTKLLQLKNSIEDIRHTFSPDTVLVTCQNGIPEDEILDFIARENIIGCSIAWGATRLERGVSKITTPPDKMDMSIGELDGNTGKRTETLSGILGNIGKVSITNNIKGIKWTKLIMNANFMGPCGSFGCKLGDVLFNPALVKYVPYIALEGAKVLDALKIKPETLQGFYPTVARLDFETDAERDELINNVFLQVWGKLSEIKPSLLQDLEKNRPTEIDYINGKISSEGKKLGIPTPVNDFFVKLIKRIESEELHPSMDNRHLLEELDRNLR
ncbi:MAG: hypothetical protein HGA49_02300, partial [Eubacteriaceae bacterium]|nr:hypothetical protein [Eubacteriaceae bacterium]